MSEHPHGVWIWVLSKVRSDYLAKLDERGVKRVYLKVYDGKSDPTFWGHQCSTKIVRQFKDHGIEVHGWGFHYGTPDVDKQVSAVKRALDCGLDGYILDLEDEVENPVSHPHVERLLRSLRPLVKPGTLGYTSFAYPKYHPNAPWSILDQLCDIAFPQIYYEAFTFGLTSEEKVQACLKAQEEFGLTKLSLPIWSSSPTAAQPAPASELQYYLKRFPGSSIWRLPHVNEIGGHVWDLTYGDEPLIVTGPGQLTELPVLARRLRQRCQGEDVAALQTALNELGFNAGPVDGDFGPRTEAAVRAFQQQAGLTIDGIVGSETWAALGGSFNVDLPPGETRAQLKLANVAQVEAAKRLSWTGPDCEAEKYLELLRKPMLDIGHIGCKPVFYNWCAAFVYWCCSQAGIQVPPAPDGFWATMALVESWKFWAQTKGYWHPRDNIVPVRGDILVFDWPDGDSALDHIGIVAGYTPESPNILTYEGNCGNRTASMTRHLSCVPGFIRITPQ